MLKVAITGNIASGKSQVENIISEMGYKVFDSDKLAHDILNNLDDFYGYDVFVNGKIDRKKLGKLVFSDPELKLKLEQLVHPKVKTKILELFEKNNNEQFVFVSVPLLYESGFDNIFDRVIIVAVNQQLQLQRLMARNNFSESEAILRINSQISQEEKLEKADYIIYNNESLDNLQEQVKNIISIL